MQHSTLIFTEEEWELTGKNVGCDINSNVNGWLVTSDEEKEYFDIDHENQDGQINQPDNGQMHKWKQKMEKTENQTIKMVSSTIQ